MSTKWTFLVILQLQSKYVKITTQSIAGVTYMDHFDFEERYRDVNECNPLFWHPLHLPPHCMDMFMKLIRSRIASHMPVRITARRDDGYIYGLKNSGYTYPLYQMKTEVVDEFKEARSPFREMLDFLEHDIQQQPIAPTMQMMPYLGPVAVYNQPVSSKSEALMKTLGKAYVQAMKSNQPDSYFLGKIIIKKAPNGGDNARKSNVDPSELESQKKFVMETLNQDQPLHVERKLKNGDTLIISKEEINSLHF